MIRKLQVAGSPRLTKNQQIVYSALQASGRATKAYDLHLYTREYLVPSAIYRALHGLEAKGLVHHLKGANLFQIVDGHMHGQNRVVFVCSSCNSVTPDSSPELFRILNRLGGSFKIRSPVEILGVCLSCQNANNETDSDLPMKSACSL